MTAYEIITIFIGILALLMSFGSLIIAFLTFLDKRNNKKKIKCLTCRQTGKAVLIRAKCILGSIHFWNGYYPN